MVSVDMGAGYISALLILQQMEKLALPIFNAS